jgi:hypothetical protein
LGTWLIIVLGIRFLLQPRQATLDFGVAADNLRALTEIKGARDITSGVLLLVVLAWPRDIRPGAGRRGNHADRGRADRDYKRREAR